MKGTIHSRLWMNALAVSVTPGTIDVKEATNTSAPGRSGNSIAQGPRRPLKEATD
jgi:hypothetical protein